MEHAMKNSIVLMAIVLILIAIPFLSYATDVTRHEIDHEMELCIDKNPTTAGMTICANEAYVRWDKELNINYNKLMNQPSVDGKKVHKIAQRKWIKFRDREFLLIEEVYSHLEGTMYVPMRANDRLTICQTESIKA